MTKQQYSQAGFGAAQGEREPWRNEVQARLERYKRRRGRRIEGAFTMRFPFPAEEPPASESEATPVVEEAPGSADFAAPAVEPSTTVAVAAQVEPVEVTDATLESKPEQRAELLPEDQPEAIFSGDEPTFETPPIPASPRPQPRRKVIAFPSPMYSNSAAPHRLADPVAPQQLRILDVPEELEAVQATPFLEGLFQASPAAKVPQPDTPELPVLPASIWKRIQASVLDATLVSVAMGIFIAAAYRFLPPLAPSKSLIAVAAVIPALLWSLYQYLFVVYAAATPGMKAAKLRLSTFKGIAPKMKQRRVRVFSAYLSVFSVGMGLLWCFVDLDSLCWHDRMSHTFLTPASD